MQIFAALVVASAAIYSFRLGTDALGASEAYSAWAAAKPTVGAIFRIPVLHDPGKQVFYYVVLHFFTRIFGLSEITLRSVSVIFAVASVAFVFALGREMFDDETALAAKPTPANSPVGIVFGTIRNPLMLCFETKSLNIEPQRRFHVGDAEKRHCLLNVRSCDGCDGHDSPHSHH